VQLVKEEERVDKSDSGGRRADGHEKIEENSSVDRIGAGEKHVYGTSKGIAEPWDRTIRRLHFWILR
jgi:hypothetical protein